MTIDKNILIDLPMPITTPRLTLRAVQPGDGAIIHAAITETFHQLNTWMPWAATLETAVQTEINCRKAYADFILRQDIRLIGFSGNNAIIFCGLHRFNWEDRDFEIGYWVRQSAQGHGYATEAANALTRYAFEALGARRVTITHAEGNENSRKIINKLGFAFEGTRRQKIKINDKHLDSHFYGRLDMDHLPDINVKWGLT